MMMMTTTTGRELIIDAGGTRLAACAWGAADDPPVLALHGWLDNAASFQRLAPLLPGLQVVALDFPGHGRSPHYAAGHPYHFLDLLPAALAAADALGWGRFRLLGHSMGAGVASLLAGAFPDRVERLALLEGLGPLSCAADDSPAQLVGAVEDRRRGDGAVPRVLPDLDSAAARLRKAYPTRSAAVARLLAERGTVRSGGGVCFAHDPRLRSRTILRMTEAHVLVFLRQIGCPTLVVRATNGWAFERAQMHARFEAVAGARLVELDGCHHVHLEQPEVVAAVVHPFLTSDDG